MGSASETEFLKSFPLKDLVERQSVCVNVSTLYE